MYSCYNFGSERGKNMASRSELREKIMTILYQITLYKKSKMKYDVEEVIKENVEIENEFVKDMVYGIITNFDELTESSSDVPDRWLPAPVSGTGCPVWADGRLPVFLLQSHRK